MAKRFPKGTIVLLASTKRGLFLFSSRTRKRWRSEGQIYAGGPIYNAVLDVRSGPRLFVTDNDPIYGARILSSDDFGESWREPSIPIRFPETAKESVRNVWIVEPGRDFEPETLYAGIDPASLWVSRDRGDVWEPVEGVLNHPTRPRWEPGGGGLCLHSIVPHPTDADVMWVAASAVGTLGTTDGGKSWGFLNAGVPASHLPNPSPEFGQCVHRLLVDPANPKRLVQQNHWGQFESLDAGASWRSIRGNLPSTFGFPLAMDPNDPRTLFAIPMTQPDEGRHNIGDQFTVWRTEDGGQEWKPLTKGLPGGPHIRLNVLRHGMCADRLDPAGVYVGTGTGQLFATADRGDTWSLVADFLPPVNAVSVATVP